ncbi:chitin deacetylase 2 [Cokeromyces recurvatus]|uniref:chitin deacetylase 2 n=1 Tax=Cokeromyces recurvatus TaxID=90255 RepID=UPI00221F9C38|nr:chitin deacetylase 2 [Cokeromyces recurvatus]KAI7903099.1 chitin deacetylase 2 [Cokeromyces recurvatus]
MTWKITLASIAVLAGVNAVTTNYTSNTDPTNITLPDIPQVTSHDPAQQCVYYNSPYTISPSEWPTVWDIATSNGINKSPEFQALYNSIDWTKVPNIPVRKLTAAGGLDMTGYDAVNDPDCWWSSSQCKTPKTAGINADLYACPEPDVWGLTFDDGPNCSHNAFYDFLQENKQKATMFYIGSNVVNWPYGALRGVRDGHQIAGHTWSHKMMTTLTNEEVLAELYYTQKAIKYVTGVTPKYWRPALGDLDDRVRWIATQLDLTAIIWNLDTFDWAANVQPGVTTQTVDDLYTSFIEMGKNGTFDHSGNIVLSHEINNQTMDFFMKHYPEIKKAYSHVLDVATCMNITHPYAESTITFPTFEQVTGGSSSNSTITPGASTVSTKANSGNTMYSFNSALFIAALFGILVLV